MFSWHPSHIPENQEVHKTILQSRVIDFSVVCKKAAQELQEGSGRLDHSSTSTCPPVLPACRLTVDGTRADVTSLTSASPRPDGHVTEGVARTLAGGPFHRGQRIKTQKIFDRLPDDPTQRGQRLASSKSMCSCCLLLDLTRHSVGRGPQM